MPDHVSRDLAGAQSGGTTVAVMSLSDPHVVLSGGTQRTRSLVDAIEASGARTQIFFPATPRDTPPAPDAAPGRGARVVESIHDLKRAFLPLPTETGGRSHQLDSELMAARPNVVVSSALSQAAFGRHADGWTWLDFMDLWSELAQRETHDRRGITRASASAQARWLAHRENKRSRAADLVTAVGWHDCELLRERGIPAEWLPVALPDQQFASGPRPRTTAVVGLLGNFGYWPNRDAYEHVVRSWLPRIRAQGWEVIVAGVSADTLDSPPPGVRIVGQVNDLSKYYDEISVSLAPVKLGGGMKVKVLESLAQGVPVIASEFALEGFPPDVRSMCATVGLDGIDFPTLEDIRQVDPSSPSLDPFRQSFFTLTVERLMAAASARTS